MIAGRPTLYWSQVWSGESWRSEAIAWLEAAAATRGITVTGAVEQPRIRPWSTQLVAPSDHGRLWFKANGPPMAFEPALVRTLSRLVPARVSRPVATDADRGWMLTLDEGPTLLESAEPGLSVWCTVVQEAARLQRELAAHEGEVLASGVPDARPARTAAIYDRMIETLSGLPAEHPSYVDPELRAEIDAVRPWLREAIALLQEGPVAPSLQHADLHPGNVFAAHPSGGPHRIFDFGDAQWAHPFEILAVPQRWLTESLGAAAAATARDAYLEVWSDLASPGDLRTLAETAVRVHAIARSMTWWDAIETMTPDELTTYGEAARDWLARLRDPVP